MAKTNKDIKKKMLINKTLNNMNKQIQKLEEQKENFIKNAKEAKMKGLTAQYDLAVSGLQMTMAQQKRVYEMKLNFEITSQMKDVTMMTTEFLKGMGVLSKDMGKIAKDAQFKKVGKQFTMAMESVEMQTMNIEEFMDETQAAFESNAQQTAQPGDRAEIESLISDEAVASNDSVDIDKALEELKKKMM